MPISQTVSGFLCNVCGTANPSTHAADRETGICRQCGATIRVRGLLLALSRELFKIDLPLPEFPVLKTLRALGISDSSTYSSALERHFSYINTFFHRRPVLDLTDPPADEIGKYDFVICSDVLEHVAPPVEAAISGIHSLLKPAGFALVTVPYSLGEETLEHFSRFEHTSLTTVGDATVLVGRDAAGSYGVIPNLIFHGGPGSTLERREFSECALKAMLRSLGFSKIRIDSAGSERFGILYDSPCSLPIIASHGDFSLPPSATIEFIEAFIQRGHILRGVRESRWVRLGRRIGLGPAIE